MKTVILAGGHGTRFSEETVFRPKPMIEIGGRPILWHIMKIYSSYGFNDFVICLGYRGYQIKEYFQNYALHSSDVTIDVRENKLTVHSVRSEPWKITLVETGEQTMTGGRVKRVAPFLDKDEPFFMTYGDGVADIRVDELLAFHRKHGRLATVTATRPPGRFGALALSGNQVTSFEEKPVGDGGYINGGFFVLSPRILESIDGDETVWEKEPLVGLASAGELQAFRHDGFWQPMDTLRDQRMLERLWAEGSAPWKTWS